jgi:lipopolysaccharide/colanic/teichoic acid biosynthesis glycosyltransferase
MLCRGLPQDDFRLRPSLRRQAGITGLAQVAGSYSTPVEQKVKFDLLYITDYSAIRDVWILLGTIPVVFEGGRAKVSSSPSIIAEE